MLSLFQKDKILSAFVILIAFSIQIQLTFFETNNYPGIRLNITDIMLPISGLLIAASLLLNKSHWPQFQIKYTYVWLSLLTAIIIGSFLHGYFRYDTLHQWALVNKTIGWLILCSYFLMGAWLVQNLNQNILIRFFYVFLSSFILITSICSILYFIHNLEFITIKIYENAPFSGLMGNKNAYIFLFATCLSLSFIWQKSIKGVCISHIIVALLPLIFMLTGSRMLLVIIIPLLIILSLLKIQIFSKKTFIAFLCGIILAVSLHIYYPISSKHVTSYVRTVKYKPSYQDTQADNYSITTSYKGDQQRLKIIDTAINMIKERPITGHGLASIQHEQKKQWGEVINILDSTPLWVLTEMGGIGLIGFLSFYLLCLQRGWKMSQSDNDTIKKVGQSLACLLIIFTLMSLLHEILYTRFLWLVMGMCLVYPVKPMERKLS